MTRDDGSSSGNPGAASSTKVPDTCGTCKEQEAKQKSRSLEQSYHMERTLNVRGHLHRGGSLQWSPHTRCEA
eukprot:CAMPEP_0171619130 /NCGR_PEP_ID=MMETSP0990-20121206/15182_1 /TAXON_ID=483369 /ORGANISM="non described non described, Strain CCMP2098" /LENGTH=71 /DNA_ID=CAMNT_0012184113 /DNA_START=637 /DNA_END=852 /DNA_ORIENTATION=-